MGGSVWRDYEGAIVLYFASRGLGHGACCNILQLKCSGLGFTERELWSVRKKLDRFRYNVEGLWSTGGRWNRERVDQHLASLGLCNIHDITTIRREEFEQLSHVRLGSPYV